MMFKKISLALLVTVAVFCCRADTVGIKSFVVRDNPFGQNQLAVVATDSLSATDEKVNGNYLFTVNGFEQQLAFNKGVAFYSPKLEKSIFLYLRHADTTGTRAMLYYVYKHDNKLSPFHINWGWLLGIPLAIIIFAYVFKRLLIIAIIILIIFLYFNYHNGLSVPTFFQSIIDGLRNAF